MDSTRPTNVGVVSNHDLLECKHCWRVWVCRVLGTNFLPSIVERGLRAPQLMEGKMAGDGDPEMP